MTPLPKAYQWLVDVRGLPNTIKYGLKELGVKEIAGAGSSATIMEWRDELNQAGCHISGFSNDDIPWCGLYVAIIAYRRLRDPYEVPRSPLWARNWASYGERSDVPSLGDILVFSRGSGGHVGFYVGEDKTCYHVLGGNQNNEVCITRIKKSRCIAVRRPPYKVKPKGCQPYRLADSGLVSSNEA